MNRYLLLLGLLLSPCLLNAQDLAVNLPSQHSDMEDYAAKELCRYVHALTGVLPHINSDAASAAPGFILGRPGHSTLVDRLIAERKLVVNTGPQGYVLKKLKIKGMDEMVIAANDETGILYGVYGYLEEHEGISFSFDGDILPARKTAADLFADLDESKTPAVAIRGLLPWTNFPQSATSYSWADWKFILDQMAKMRLNFLHIHNYSGEEGHNEMFHNFELDGKLSRVWNATAKSGHAWGSYPGWDVNKYLFGSAGLFDDYDFGADCALHNEGLSNAQVFRKGANEFERVIAYAHTRGIKIGLGLDINLIPSSYHMDPADTRVVAARVKQIETDYPNLDYLLCFQSEGLADPSAVKERKEWREIFDGFYKGLKKTMPHLRLAVSGWGIRAEDVASLPEDVICAPISHYSDGCEDGSVYGKREYWGCPWLERDFSSSVYYYPYNMNISGTIKAWQNRAPNMKGFYALTWRLTDAVKAKVWYMSRAPWDVQHELNSSRTLYAKFAEQQYGKAAVQAITPIIDQNEPFASDFSECRWTPPFSLAPADGRAPFLFNLLSFRAGNGSEQMAVSYSANNQTRNAPGNSCVGYITPGSWLAYENFSFDPAQKQFVFKAASPTDGGRIELRLGSPDGRLIGEGEVLPTGEWDNWTESTVAIQPVSGQHTLYLVFRAREAVKLAQVQLDKAISQIKTVDSLIAQTADAGDRFRLGLLKSRLSAERDHIVLNMDAPARSRDVTDMVSSWVGNFNSRVTDISSLGNVVSVQNRFVHNNYISLARLQLNTYNTLAPESVAARGTKEGIRICWQTNDPRCKAFDIYRDGEKIKEISAGTRSYEDKVSGPHRYEVYSLFWGNDDANASVTVTAIGGDSDRTPPQIVLISPPTSVLAGQPAAIKVHLLDNRTDELLSATLYYRAPGAAEWTDLPMARRVKSTFTAVIPANAIGAAGLEYYISATDGTNQSVFPANAPGQPLSLTREDAPAHFALSAPRLMVSGNELRWQPVKGASYYKIYRSANNDFIPGFQNSLTYIASGACLSFRDNGADLSGNAMTGNWYYWVTAVDSFGFEGPAAVVRLHVKPGTYE